MASVPHKVGADHPSASRVVLPITSRGIELTDRVCWGILAVAMAIAAGLILYLNRGTTFFLDEPTWVFQTPGLGPSDVLDPHNGHLIATTRLVYKAILETIGAEYVAFRVLAAATVLLSAGLFYALARRRIGAVAALAPTFVLLFFGSAWQHVVVPVGFTVVFSIAAGLAALLALERGDRRGDIAASALLVLSVATYTTGLGFLVGAAVSVLLRPDRRRRAWIFLIPIALYAAWWLWSTSSVESPRGETRASNFLLIPNWAADSLAVVTAALTGVDFDFTREGSPNVDLTWGRVLAVVAIIALALRIRKGNVPASLWASLGIVLTYWALGALAFGVDRTPDAIRYLYMGGVGVLLVATDAARGIRFSRLGLIALFAACALSLVTNLAILRDAGAYFRTFSDTAGAELAMLELSRGTVDPDFDPTRLPGFISPLVQSGARAGTYFTVVDRYGSPALPVSELERKSAVVRENADLVLSSALDLRLEPAARLPAEGCRQVRADPATGIATFELPSGGATLLARATGPAEVTVGRFADSPGIGVGSLAPGEAATLPIPADDASKPWRASVGGARSVKACPVG